MKTAPTDPQQNPPQGQKQTSEIALRSPSPFGALGLLRRLVNAPAEVELDQFLPSVEVMRRGDKLAIEVDLPGMAPDDVKVSVEPGVLMIEGERRAEHESKEGEVWTSERSYGHFQRQIHLPENADPDSAEARFENGVLEVTITAPEQKSRSKQIEVKASAPAKGKH